MLDPHHVCIGTLMAHLWACAIKLFTAVIYGFS
jgi:hypothetical protein